MSILQGIFDKEAVNTNRQKEIDLSRGYTALLVVLCHVGLYLGSPSNKVLYTFSDIIGSESAAPVFMTLMGISVLYSRHNDAKSMCLRGIYLFLSGYLLSAIRSLIPLFLLGNIDEWTSWDAFFVVDILQFAGLSFLFLSLLRKLRIPSVYILLLSLVMVKAGEIFISNPLFIENQFLVYVLDLFVPVNKWSCFPFLTWFFFPCLGLLIGGILCHCKDKKRMYEIVLPVSLIGVLYVYYQFYLYYPDYAEHYYYGGNFYYMGIRNVLLTSFFITFSLSSWYFIERLLPFFIRRFLTYLGKNLTVFYVFSWIYISITIHIKSMFSLNFDSFVLIFLMILFIVLSYLSAYYYCSIKNALKEKRVK